MTASAYTLAGRVSLRFFLCLVILATQFGIAAWYHLGERRYFAWAPNDYVVTYDLQVMVGARSMTADEIASRYRLDLRERVNEGARTHLGLDPSAHYVWEDPPQHLIDRIQGYELAYGEADSARVTLLYQVAGGPLQEWHWPA